LELIRLYPGDEQRLRQLRLRALQDAPEAFGSTYEETAQRPPASWVQQIRDLATFVVVRDKRDVGMVRGAPGHGGVRELISMWVAPEARGLGVGDALVEATIDWARGVGATGLSLEVHDNNAPAIALYTRHGFEFVRQLPDSGEHERLLTLV